MSPKVVVLRDGGAPRDGDVIIDARGTPQFYDAVILSGRELRSIVATGVVNGGIPIGIGKYTKKTVAAVVGDKIYIRGVPLTLYEEAGLLEKEISEVLAKAGADTDYILRRLKEIVVAERRRNKRSQTLAQLSQYLSGQVDSLPPHIADLVGNLDRAALQKLFDKLVEELY
ncbi:hypothetical protein [Pyrobaculum neutrophilum]|uniref:Uncharacterized protein n=1 Tax=Pyrobaculum neutrophilum (strain DSM 2338 / JCM 9278 / NBRC 100436 / V24Sta) TaxID=444157 RepID=B1Y9A5_PYRNV|nr:hypothetical protein [Pyrobaculum neutrophilum]ACB40334.1 conserved hypothetical protein [Pyrobaculum neutrophilum V24Sta]